MVQPPNDLARLFLPCDALGTAFEGFIMPRNPASCPCPYLWLRVSNIRPAEHGGLSEALLECGPGLQELLQGREAKLAQRCSRCPSLQVLLEEVQELLDEALREKQAQVPPSLAFYNAVVQELDELGWSNVAELTKDCTLLVLQTRDAAGRPHQLQLQLPSGFPMEPPVLSCPPDLPQPLQLIWHGGRRRQLSSQRAPLHAQPPEPRFSQLQHHHPQPFISQQGGAGGGSGLLRSALDQLEQALHQYQELWACLEDFDEHAYVLEPAAVPAKQSAGEGAGDGWGTRGGVRGGGAVRHRRVSLGRHCSLEVTLDALDPRSVIPQVRFLGPPDVVNPLQSRLQSNLGDWDSDRTPRQNLEQLLGVTIPRAEGTAARGAMDMDECQATCAVCYAFYLPRGDEGPGDTPDVHCSAVNCGRAFHVSCLLECLRVQPDMTSSFGTMFGKCPYCSNSIAVKGA